MNRRDKTLTAADVLAVPRGRTPAQLAAWVRLRDKIGMRPERGIRYTSAGEEKAVRRFADMMLLGTSVGPPFESDDMEMFDIPGFRDFVARTSL